MALFFDLYNFFIKTLENSICYYFIYSKIKRLSIRNLKYKMKTFRTVRICLKKGRKEGRKETKQKLLRRWLSGIILAMQE